MIVHSVKQRNNPQKEKAISEMGENIFKSLIYRICKELLRFNNNNNKKSYFKIGKGVEKTFIQRIYANVQESYKKMFILTNHHENVNQNHNAILPYTHQDGGGLVAKSCLTLATPWTVAQQALLFMGFPRQEYWSGLPFPSPGDPPDPGTELGSPAWQADPLLIELVRMATITKQNISVGEYMEKLEMCELILECKMLMYVGSSKN